MATAKRIVLTSPIDLRLCPKANQLNAVLPSVLYIPEEPSSPGIILSVALLGVKVLEVEAAQVPSIISGAMPANMLSKENLASF
ncbi:MAG: hypothetical protein HC764_03970 [Pleurocapsa sp. CRU_1_2]|nr:hypothetical protein [Pleurocapsa sp. CRU_1_2]